MLTKIQLFSIFLLLISSGCGDSRHQDSDGQPVAYKSIGFLEKVDPEFDNIVPTDAKIEVLAEGFDWSEGPLWLPEHKILLWSDVPKNTIYSWTESEGAQTYLNPSGYTGEGEREGSNGLLLSPDGELMLCQHGDRRMAKMVAPLDKPTPNYQTLADRYDGKRFNSPNDAAYDQEGYLYFTDPPYGLPKQQDDPGKEIPFQGVYCISPDGVVTLLVDDLTRPNGIAFSPDFKKCYVANSDPASAIWMVYDVAANKKLSNGRIFFDATSMVGEKKGLPDGLKVRSDGTIFATGPGGVLVFTPVGKHLGTIVTGEATANCAFNEDESVLFMTADAYVARIRLK